MFDSPNLHCTDSVLVFSPSAEKDLPTLFLLHGFSGKYSDWSRHTDLQAAAESSGFRIICPDGFYKSWYFNDANPANMQWRTFFWEECWPELDKRYGLKADKTFIDGLSMGGHGAMNIFLDHPERFRGAGSMSGVLVLHHSGTSKEIIPGILGVESIYDPVCAAESAINRLERIGDAAPQKIILISCGTEDKFMVPSKEGTWNSPYLVVLPGKAQLDLLGVASALSPQVFLRSPIAVPGTFACRPSQQP